MDPLLGVERVVEAREGGPVEEEGADELDRRGQPVEPPAFPQRLDELQGRRAGEEERSDEEGDPDGDRVGARRDVGERAQREPRRPDREEKADPPVEATRG